MESYIKIYSKIYKNKKDIILNKFNIPDFYFYCNRFEYSKIVNCYERFLWFDKDMIDILDHSIKKYTSKREVNTRYLILEMEYFRIHFEFYNSKNDDILRIIISNNDIFSFEIENCNEEIILN
jgi:hypothetical protein